MTRPVVGEVRLATPIAAADLPLVRADRTLRVTRCLVLRENGGLVTVELTGRSAPWPFLAAGEPPRETEGLRGFVQEIADRPADSGDRQRARALLAAARSVAPEYAASAPTAGECRCDNFAGTPHPMEWHGDKPPFVRVGEAR